MKGCRAKALACAIFMLSARNGFCQTGEEANFTDFNWHALMGLDSSMVIKKLWEHARTFKEGTYNAKAILDIELDLYAKAKELEKTFPYDGGTESRSRYKVTHDRKYSEWLDLSWEELLKLNVRSAMQYILLEILYTKNIPKSKNELPMHWSLFKEYFTYYCVLKSASR